MGLSSSDILRNVHNTRGVQSFINIVGDSEFWDKTQNLADIMRAPAKYLTECESDSSYLSNVFKYFILLQRYFNELGHLSQSMKDELKAIIMACWKFILKSLTLLQN
jgi:HD-like signal output (HDOD) protein